MMHACCPNLPSARPFSSFHRWPQQSHPILPLVPAATPPVSQVQFPSSYPPLCAFSPSSSNPGHRPSSQRKFSLNPTDHRTIFFLAPSDHVSYCQSLHHPYSRRYPPQLVPCCPFVTSTPQRSSTAHQAGTRVHAGLHRRDSPPQDDQHSRYQRQQR